MEEPTSGFVIDDKTYPVPTLDTFDMDEAQLLYEYANVTVEDFASLANDASEEEIEAHESHLVSVARNPAFKRALLHIAYRRGNPSAKSEQVREIIGRVNLVEATLALVGEDDASPPETSSQSEHSNGSSSSDQWRSEDSGSPSPSASDPQADLLASTGTSRSDTSSTFVPTT